MSLALARKYRPRRFDEVAVQSHVSDTLRGAIARDRVAHGYLLCGPRGVGKTTLARVLAMALNCERRTADSAGEPCGECTSCERIWSGSASLDVIEIDAASNRGVDDARDLRERAMYAPSSEERYKVYIVDEAHMLTREAWNALLKVLEEPPPRVIFVFATTEPQKIAQSAAPVLSRLQRFDLKRIGPADIRARLEDVLARESVEWAPDALEMIARAADGSMRDALSLTDQVLSLGEGTLTSERIRSALGLVAEDEFLEVLDLIAERRAADAFVVMARLADAGSDFGLVLTGLADVMRAQLAVTLGGQASGVSERMRGELDTRRDRLAAADLLRMLNVLSELEPRFRRSGQQQLLLETTLVRLALLDRTVELESVLRELSGGGASPGSGNRQASPGRRPPPGSASPAGGRPVARDARPRDSQAAHSSPLRVENEAPVAAAGPGVGGSSAQRAERQVPLAAGESAESPSAGMRPTELDALVERWGEIASELRAAGRVTLATAVGHTRPVSLSGTGVLLLESDHANAFFDQALEAGRGQILEAVARHFSGITRVTVRGNAAAAPPERLTEEGIRTERIALLRRKDPALGAAIDAFDLELLE